MKNNIWSVSMYFDLDMLTDARLLKLHVEKVKRVEGKIERKSVMTRKV